MTIYAARPLVFTFLLFIYLVVSTAGAQERERLDSIVAIVNDDVILASELSAEISSILRKLAQANAPQPRESELREQALERLIVHNLQMAEAAKLGIAVDDETLAKSIANIAERNKLTLAEMNEALQQEGLDMEYYREDLREQIILNQLRSREVYNRIQITKAEVDNYLEHEDQQPGGRTAFHVLHILVATPEGASSSAIAAARGKADSIVQRLRGGADFRTLALRESDGRQALEGGDLGWVEAGQLPSIFGDEVASMERGETAGPLQSTSGFHVIQLVDYRGGDRKIINQTHARHILIRTSEVTSDDDARGRLLKLRDRIVNGEDFATLARSNSEDKVSAIKGGDLGWISPGDLVPKFEEVMDALAKDETSEVFRTQFGWHIVQVLERREHDATEDARRSKAKVALRTRKADEALELYVRKLRDQAFVEIRPTDTL